MRIDLQKKTESSIDVNSPRRDSSILYIACDATYLRRYGIAFAMAAAKHHWPLHVSGILEHDNSAELHGLLQVIADAFSVVACNSVDFSWSIDLPWRKWNSESERGAIMASCRYFSSARFLKGLSEGQSLLITDVDALINAPSHLSVIPVDQIGLFIRNDKLDVNCPDWIKLGTAINAGLVHIPCSQLGVEYLRLVGETIESLEAKWFVDQVALFLAYRKLSECSSVYRLNESHLTSDMKDSSMLWSAKGDRKNGVNRYTKKKKRLLRLFAKALSGEL